MAMYKMIVLYEPCETSPDMPMFACMCSVCLFIETGLGHIGHTRPRRSLTFLLQESDLQALPRW